MNTMHPCMEVNLKFFCIVYNMCFIVESTVIALSLHTAVGNPGPFYYHRGIWLFLNLDMLRSLLHVYIMVNLNCLAWRCVKLGKSLTWLCLTDQKSCQIFTHHIQSQYHDSDDLHIAQEYIQMYPFIPL